MILDRIFGQSGGHRVVDSEDLARELEGWSSSSSGANVTPERALLYACVFACIRVLAESVGQLPLHLYEQRGREKQKATKHPLYSLLHTKPNHVQTSQEWKEFSVASMALRGNAYHYINRNNFTGRILELEPLHPTRVTPRQHKDTLEIIYEVRDLNGKPETLPAREVLHLKLFPLDALLGASPVEYARETIGLGIAAEEHGGGLFKNGANPGGVLQSTKALSEGAFERLKTSWEARHRGSKNAHRVAILEDGVTWQSIGMSSSDAQFLETRKYQRSEIAGIYRVPPHLIGDLERATFSNIEHQSLDFVVHSLMPYLTRIEQRISVQLLTDQEREVYFPKFSVAGLLRGDMQARAQFYSQQVQNGALSPNEIRELEDMNPREGGDVYLTPANMLINGKPPERAGGAE